MRHKLRNKSSFGSKRLHFCDNLSAVLCACKGRSSSYPMLAPLEDYVRCWLQLTANCSHVGFLQSGTLLIMVRVSGSQKGLLVGMNPKDTKKRSRNKLTSSATPIRKDFKNVEVPKLFPQSVHPRGWQASDTSWMARMRKTVPARDRSF